MLSEVIHARHSYPALPLAEQLVHQRSVHSGPLVLGANFLKNRRLQQIGDQPVSRMLPTITRCIGLEHHRELMMSTDGRRSVSTDMMIYNRKLH